MNTGLARDRELVEPHSELELVFQQSRKAQYLIQQVQMAKHRDPNNPIDPFDLNVGRVPTPIILAAPTQVVNRPIREVEIPLTNHVTNSIRKIKPGG